MIIPIRLYLYAQGQTSSLIAGSCQIKIPTDIPTDATLANVLTGAKDHFPKDFNPKRVRIIVNGRRMFRDNLAERIVPIYTLVIRELPKEEADSQDIFEIE